MTSSATLAQAASDAQRAYLAAYGRGVRGDDLEVLRQAQDATASAVNAWGRRQQALAIPTDRADRALDGPREDWELACQERADYYGSQQ